jgi:hypothetical protein
MAMTTEHAQGLVVTAFTVSAGLVLIKDAHDNKMPPARFVIGTFASAVMLAAAAQFVPDLAGGMALLVLTTAALVYGGPAWQVLTSATSTKK